eukprot:5482175-Amphidinium_carterae.1
MALLKGPFATNWLATSDISKTFVMFDTMALCHSILAVWGIVARVVHSCNTLGSWSQSQADPKLQPTIHCNLLYLSSRHHRTSECAGYPISSKILRRVLVSTMDMYHVLERLQLCMLVRLRNMMED